MNKNKIKPQELLTGKAKEAFEKWMYNRYDSVILKEEEEIYWCHYSKEVTLLDVFEKLPIELQQSSIIDWLDSVGIYVETFVLSQDREIGFCFNISGNETFEDGMWYDTRTQATQEAIKKAVEIYNKGAN